MNRRTTQETRKHRGTYPKIICHPPRIHSSKPSWIKMNVTKQGSQAPRHSCLVMKTKRPSGTRVLSRLFRETKSSFRMFSYGETVNITISIWQLSSNLIRFKQFSSIGPHTCQLNTTDLALRQFRTATTQYWDESAAAKHNYFHNWLKIIY